MAHKPIPQGPAGPVPSEMDVLAWSPTVDPYAVSNVGLRLAGDLSGSWDEFQAPVSNEEVIEHHVEAIVSKVVDKMDTVVLVDGKPGVGKSTFSLGMNFLIRSRLHALFGSPKRFSLEEDVLYRLSSLIRRIYQSSREKPLNLLADESVLIGGQARSGLSDSGQILDYIMQVSRIQSAIVFVLAPSIRGIMAGIRERRAEIYFHVEKRGKTTAFHLSEAIPFKRTGLLPYQRERPPWKTIFWDSLEGTDEWKWYDALKVEATKRALIERGMAALRLEKKMGLGLPDWALPISDIVGNKTDDMDLPSEPRVQSVFALNARARVSE